MSAGDWIALGVGIPTVVTGALWLWHSMKIDALNQQNRLQDRIWELEDELRRGGQDG